MTCAGVIARRHFRAASLDTQAKRLAQKIAKLGFTCQIAPTTPVAVVAV